jgi:hypothetical protein
MSQDQKKVIPQGVQKFTAPLYEDTDEFGIDSMLKKELEDQGLEYRFIDFKQAKLNGGRSRAGWIVYKRQSVDPRLQGIASLADPDGLVRQGSMVLAVKPTAAAQRQRSRRDAQNKTLTKYTETVTQELNGEAKKLGGSSRVIAGYDKNS